MHLIFLATIVCSTALAADPACDLNALDLIHYWGYPAEQHEVTTEDGYLLHIQRIPHGKKGRDNVTKPKPVIFLQHGLEGSATNWLTNLPNQSAAYIFADAGFDVWMGNFRGNTYSRGHVNPNISPKKYWDFSWDEMALKDLPAMVDYVLRQSGQQSLYYVGHSEGTMTFFALSATRPAYTQAKVRKFFALGPVASVAHIGGWDFFALGPVASVAHIGGLIGFIANFEWPLEKALKFLGVNDFVPQTWIVKEFGEILCGHKVTDKLLCENVYFLLFGANTENLNASRLEVYLAHNPAGTSTKNIFHFAQGVKKEAKFEAYDYGVVGNLKHYGTPWAHSYPLGDVSVPTYLFWGTKDVLADEQDIYETILPNVNTIQGNYKLDMNHCDFIYGLNAPKLVYEPITNITRAHEDALSSRA